MRAWQIGAVAVACGLCGSGIAAAAEVTAEMQMTTPAGPGDKIGTVTISDSPAGASVKPGLKGLPPGPHGFHIHENGSCAPTTVNNAPVPAGGAGGHFDPQKTGKHEGPEGS